MAQRENSQHDSALEASESNSFRAGFVTFVGRPNVGKSTLTNALAGNKIAITSPKPQTTRKAIRAIVHRESGQIVIVDTPGIHRPKKLLGYRLNDLVGSVLGDVDVICMLVPATDEIGPGDRFILEELKKYPAAKKIAVVTKTDIATSAQTIARLAEIDPLADWSAVVPLSAVSGEQLDVLTDVLVQHLPVSMPLYSAEQVTEESRDELVAEIIRESAIISARQELPHSLAVTIDDAAVDSSGALTLYASIYVERDSQKGIVIGKGGSNLSKIRQRARREIAKNLGQKISLSVQVKVLKDWQSDPKHLNRLGF